MTTNSFKNKLSVIVDNTTSENFTNTEQNNPIKNKRHEEYQTNPMYEKLLNFQSLQKKKRFTVDDLLSW